MTPHHPAPVPTAPPEGAAEILRRARAASPDPYPDLLPRPTTTTWFHLPGERELGTLHHLVAAGRAAGRHVDYPETYAAVAPSATFRHRAARAAALRLSTSGPTTVTVGGTAVAGTGGAALHDQAVAVAAGDLLVVGVEAPTDGAAALGLHDDDAPEADARGAGAWEVRAGDAVWRPAEAVRGTAVPPHAAGEPTTVVTLARTGDGLFTAPAPALGHVVVELAPADDPEGGGNRGEAGPGGVVPVLVTGESVPEALADPADGESRTDLVRRPDGTWASRHRLGLRHASVRGARALAVRVEAAVRPAPRRGAFVTSDPRLDAVWASSALTLRLCMQSLMVDGIKRDRMPWIGDIGLSLASNAYAFGDPEVVRASLRALGDPRSHLVNGISDYSLWWVVSHALHRLHFDDAPFVAGQAASLDAFLDRLAADTDERGVLRPRPDLDAFPEAGPGAVLIDWGVRLEAGRDPVALQVLWCWALRSAAKVLDAAGHPGAARWADLAARVRALLLAEGRDPATGAWRTYLDERSGPDPYATLLAVHAGLAGPASARPGDGAGDDDGGDDGGGAGDGGDDGGGAAPLPASAVDVVRSGDYRTPFMRTLALRALGRAGHRAEAVRAVAAEWGAMLDAGATTFWEEFPRAGTDPLAMYGRPFGKSLCHGWAAGPAAALPELVLGLEPLEPGWSTVTVAPELGELRWAAAVVPLSGGDLAVVAHDDGPTVVDLPAGCTLVVGEDRWAGPARVTLP